MDKVLQKEAKVTKVPDFTYGERERERERGKYGARWEQIKLQDSLLSTLGKI